MLKSLPILLIAASVVLAAPIPKAPPPDPLGRGYVGFFPLTDEDYVPIIPITIKSVEPGSPAAKAGLQANDIFVQVGSFKPKTFNQLKDYVMDFRPGTEVKIVVRRRNKLETLRMTLGARPAEADNQLRSFPIPDDPDR